jgi:hypothetical protein
VAVAISSPGEAIPLLVIVVEAGFELAMFGLGGRSKLTKKKPVKMKILHGDQMHELTYV